MELKFVKINPVGNMTVLVTSPVLKENYAEISKKLMEYTNLHCEQVGFITNNHIQMMGGEFCGNAARAFAAYLAMKDNNSNDRKSYNITSSGSNEELSILVSKTDKKNVFFSKIKMPRLLSIKEESIEVDLEKIKIIKVTLEGIIHFIVEKKKNDEIIELILDKMKDEEYEAFGVLFFDRKNMEMIPYVHVKNLSGVWELSCASGTVALGYYLDKENGISNFKVLQPGGYLEVEKKGEELFIDGEVEIVAEGIVYI